MRKIIHIGLHKTASTYLQRNFFNALEGINYIEGPDYLLGLGKVEFRTDNILISREQLSGMPWDEDWLNGKRNEHSYLASFYKTIDNLVKLFPDAEIILVLRKQGDLVLSLYKQYLQEGGILKLNQFYDEKGVIQPRDLYFKQRTNYLEKKFKKVHILSFEEFKKEGDVYFQTFFKDLGFITKKKDNLIATNKSISGKKIDCLRRSNVLFKILPYKIQLLFSYLGVSPRKIFQEKLNFWKTKDEEKLYYLKKNQ